MVKMPKKISFDKNRKYEWLIISQSYFQCALMNARVLKEKLSNYSVSEDSPLDFCLKKIYGDYLQSYEYLIFPIIFNFKHGIEIYLKAIAGIKNNEFNKEHNLLSLWREIEETDEKIKCIIRKYAFGHLFLPVNSILDKENEFERYPQGSPYDNLDFFLGVDGKRKETVTQAKIIELIEDMEFLYKEIRKVANNALKQYKK